MLVIRTSPRPGADYLPGLVAACDAAGVGGTILNDGREPVRLTTGSTSGWVCSATGALHGSLRCGWYALELAAGQGQDLLLLEDDVMPAPGAIGAMFDYEVPCHLAFVSFFDGRRHPRVAGLLELPCVRFLYAQALKLPLATVRKLLVGRPPADDPMASRHMFDWWLGRLCSARVAPRYGLMLPNLVEHRGDVSLVFPGRAVPIRSTWFAGDEPC